MMMCPWTVSALQLRPTSELILLLLTQDLIPNAILSVQYLMHPCAIFSLVLGPSLTVSPPKYNTLPLIFHSVNMSSNPVHGPSVMILTGNHWALICPLTPSTCTSPSSLLTVFSSQARLSTNAILLRFHIVRLV